MSSIIFQRKIDKWVEDRLLPTPKQRYTGITFYSSKPKRIVLLKKEDPLLRRILIAIMRFFGILKTLYVDLTLLRKRNDALKALLKMKAKNKELNARIIELERHCRELGQLCLAQKEEIPE